MRSISLEAAAVAILGLAACGNSLGDRAL